MSQYSVKIVSDGKKPNGNWQFPREDQMSAIRRAKSYLGRNLESVRIFGPEPGMTFAMWNRDMFLVGTNATKDLIESVRLLTTIERTLEANLGNEITINFWEPGPSSQGLSRRTGIIGYINSDEQVIGVYAKADSPRDWTMNARDIWNIVSIDETVEV